MQNTWAKIVYVIIVLLLMGFPNILAAQQNNDDSSDPAIESDWDDFFLDLYVKGDQTFIIALGTVFPTIFLYRDKSEDAPTSPDFTPPVGGTGSLIYNYYLNPRLFLGGEIAGLFIHTLGGNTLFIVPLGFRVGTQYNLGKFEFPLSLSLGMCWHTYLTMGYYGLYMKAGGSAYYRATHEWSFGLTANWGWFPQWTFDRNHNVDGNFVDILFSARYHF